MVSDAISQYLPFLLETKRMLASGEPWWSWNILFGDDFITGMSYYTLFSPFAWVALLLPYDMLPFSITFIMLLKLIFIGVAARLYLRKMGVSDTNANLGAWLYAFSSFTITSLYYFLFCEAIGLFPLLLLAIERLLRGERYGWQLYAIMVGVTILVNWYFGCTMLLVVALYFLVRITDKNIGLPMKLTVNTLFATFLGVCLAMVILLPIAYSLTGTERWESAYFIDRTLIFDRLRSFFMPTVSDGPATEFFSTACWSSNSVAIPLFGIALAWLYIRRYSDRLSALLILFAILYVTTFTGFFSLFTSITYTRWAYALTLFIVLASVRVLDDEANPIPSRWGYIFSGIMVAVLTVSLFWRWRHHLDWFDSQAHSIAIGTTVAFTLLTALLLAICASHKFSRPLVLACVAVLAMVHVGITHWVNLIDNGSMRDIVSTFITNNPHPRNNGNTFYCRTFFYTGYNYDMNNMPCIANMPGVQSYTSMFPTHSTRLAKQMTDERGAAMLNYTPTKNLDSFCSLMSVRNVSSYRDVKVSAPPISGLMVGEHYYDYKDYYYSRYIPMGFAYDEYAVCDTIPQNVDAALLMLNWLIVDSADAEKFKSLRMVSVNDALMPLDSIVKKRREIVCSEFVGDGKGFTAKISLPRQMAVFFSVPAARGFTARVDGQQTEILKANLGMSALVLPKGDHTIEFSYFTPGLKVGAWISLSALLLILISMFFQRRKENKRNSIG